MRNMLVGAVLGLVVLVGCGGDDVKDSLGGGGGDDNVDRSGTRDEIIEQLEAAGLTADADCIDEAMEKYSDEELKEIDEALGSGETTEESDALLAEISGCISYS